MVETVGLLICVPLYLFGLFFLGTSITCGLIVFHVAIVPIIFKYSKAFRRNLVFINFIQWPINVDFDEPSASGIDGARNLSIEYHSKIDNCEVKIGMWHILPETVYERLKDNIKPPCDKEELNRIFDEELATTSSPIILYCHGNSNSRVANHRIQLYQFFQKMDFHTITFDYRGYGDSTNLKPTEAGVVEDALVVYEWLNSIVGKYTKPPIFVWGHSLGTAISSHLLGNLQELSMTLLERNTPLPLPNGLILEAPFNNLADEVAKIPFSKLVTWLPYFEATFVAPFRTNKEQTFKTDEHLSKQKKLPVLILHAKDDVIVPFIVGVKLFRSIQSSRKEDDAKVQLHAITKDERLGHSYICNYKNLDIIIRKFIMDNK